MAAENIILAPIVTERTATDYPLRAFIMIISSPNYNFLTLIFALLLFQQQICLVDVEECFRSIFLEFVKFCAHRDVNTEVLKVYVLVVFDKSFVSGSDACRQVYCLGSIGE